MRVVRDQNPAAQILQVRMLHDGLHQPFAEPVGAVIFVNEDVAQIAKDRVIADDARHSDLFVSMIDAEDERMFEGAFRAFTWTRVCPIGAREKIADGINIEPRRVGADGVLIAVDFNDLWHGMSLS